MAVAPLSISDIAHVFYINLDSRPDRAAHVRAQLAAIGLGGDGVAQRFRAIALKNGALGCSMSHLRLLEQARDADWPHIMIVEDDILFTQPAAFVRHFEGALKSTNGAFDVLLLAGNNTPPYTQPHAECARVTRCQTTTGYLVLRHYYDRLIANYREGIARLIKEPQHHVLYAIDKYWFALQQHDRWFLVTPLTVTQRDDYSDIEQRQTNYSRAMLDLDKTAFFQWQREQQAKAALANMKGAGRPL